MTVKYALFVFIPLSLLLCGSAFYCSGYASNRVINDYKNYGFRASVKKPVNMAELIKAVGEVIGETA